MKYLLELVVFIALFFGAAFAHGQAPSGRIPTVEGNNVWNGLNVYTPGNLQLSSPTAPCPTGQYASGLDATFSPLCSTPLGSEGGAVVYPAQCGESSPPFWCSGTTADAWIRSACTQLPSTGGTINLLGLTGTIAASVPCSTPTKQVIILHDPTSRLTITESDGRVVFPLDNASMFLGPGGGQCEFGGGIHLASSANVTAIVGPAHTDGTEENFTAQGLCLWGASGATVSKGLLYTKATFTNTTFNDNNVSVCPNACLWIENVGGLVNVWNDWFNVTSGVYTINGSAIVVASSGSAGCENSSVNISGGTAEHANGGANFPEINIHGDGAGALGCSISVHDLYIEKNVSGTPSTAGIKIQDCFSCSFSNIQGGGGSGTRGDMINLSATASNRVQNVSFSNISNVFGSWTNTINDTTTNGVAIPFSTFPYVTSYVSRPGYIQPAVFPGTTIQALVGDVMGGLGNFSTGDSSFGTSFGPTGCNVAVTCTSTRTNSTAPPGSTFSQEVQITANTDPSSGYNGVQYGPTVSFTAGQTYIATFWGKGDGSFTGFPTFLLWNSLRPVFYCNGTTSTPFTTTWTLYRFTCTPTTSGSAFLAVAGRTPVGATGTFWLGDFVFSPVGPLTPGNFVAPVGPYRISTNVKGVSIGGGAGAPTSTCGTAPTASGSLWLRTDGGTSTTLYVCNGTTWTPK